MQQHDFKTYSYFSWHVRVMAIGLSVVGLSLLTTHQFIGILVLLMCLFTFTTHYRLRIDVSKKQFQDYLWIGGLKQGKTLQFENIEYFFIKKSNVSQTMGMRAANTTTHKEIFDAYLKFSEKQKIYVLSADRKENLLRRLRPMANALQVKIVDYSEA